MPVFTRSRFQNITDNAVQIALAVLLIVGLCAGYGMSCLHTYSSGQKELITVAAIQGNIDQAIKWDRDHRQQIFDTYARLSRMSLAHQPDLIVWPETAVPFVFQYEDLPFTFTMNPTINNNAAALFTS